jgi:hypothetical protein
MAMRAALGLLQQQQLEGSSKVDKASQRGTPEQPAKLKLVLGIMLCLLALKKVTVTKTDLHWHESHTHTHNAQQQEKNEETHHQERHWHETAQVPLRVIIKANLSSDFVSYRVLGS